MLIRVAKCDANVEKEMKKAKDLFFTKGVRIGMFNYYGVLAGI